MSGRNLASQSATRELAECASGVRPRATPNGGLEMRGNTFCAQPPSPIDSQAGRVGGVVQGGSGRMTAARLRLGARHVGRVATWLCQDGAYLLQWDVPGADPAAVRVRINQRELCLEVGCAAFASQA